MTAPEPLPGPASIARLTRAPSYTEFLESYLIPNLPVLIGTDLIKEWAALEDWTKPTESEPSKEIHWRHLADVYGDQDISVADCEKRDSFDNIECDSAFFRDVVSKWEMGEGRSLYVKDWHLARSVENTDADGLFHLHPFYNTPDIFKDDWMNAYYTSHTSDDFRFVYVGAAGTYTPLHRDVYCSYSWSTNISGRKRWWLFHPEQTPLLFMKGRNVCIHDVRNVDLSKFPDFGESSPIVVEQEEGETIFVPSGWYHQVVNLTACISINHNWCNSVNLPMLYSSMCAKVVEVETALDDVRELLMKAHPDDETAWKSEFCAVVQQLVEQDAGWNWLTFWRMIAHALRNVAMQEGLSGESKNETASCSTERSQPVFPCAPTYLRPPSLFIRERARRCYDDFVLRDRLECQGEVQTVVEEVAQLLDTKNEYN